MSSSVVFICHVVIFLLKRGVRRDTKVCLCSEEWSPLFL
jgi:hypothetical protein